MIERIFTQRFGWLGVSLAYCIIFFMLDQFFVHILEEYAGENRLFYHRLALFSIVTIFIFWTQYTVHKLYDLNKKMIHTTRLSTLGEMSAMMAHELVRPITVLALEAELNISEQSKPVILREYSQHILKQTSRCTTIINSLRNYGRGGDSSEKADSSLNELIVSSCKFVQPFMGTVTIKQDFDIDLPLVRVNGNQLEQVLSNLLINAKDAIESAGSGSVKVSTMQTTGAILVEICNDGPTISSDVLSKMFDPFFTTKINGKGSGLGLAISKRIMEEHGGSITVKSQYEKTCFRLRFDV